MFKSIFSKKNIPFLLLDIILITSSFFFVSESFGRFLFVLITILFYILISYIFKNRVIGALLFIFSILPFNVTYQMPSSVEVFGTTLSLYDPYVNGVIVNYLIPTISIVDLGIFLLLYSVLFTYGLDPFKRIFLKYKYWLILLLIYFILRILLQFDLLVLLNSFRIIGVLLSLFVIIPIIKEYQLFKKNLKFLFLLILFVTVLTEGVFSASQVLKGSSLGFPFLGESQVVSGMRGSSFVEFGGQLFLRGYGTFPHPNILAGFLLLASVIAFSVIFRSKGYTRLLSIFILLSSSIFVLFSLSRIAIFLFVFNYLIVLIWKLYESFKKVKVFSFNFLPLLYLSERFANIFDAKDNSLVEREQLMIASFKVMERNFLIGTGVGNFVRAMADFVPRSLKGIMILQPVHNIFLLSLSEFGLLGFVFFWGMICKYLYVNIKRFTFLTFIALVDILVIGSFDHYLLSLPQGLVIFISFLLLAILNSDSSKQDEYYIE